MGETEQWAKLTAAERDALPDSAFALPGRRYPIHDENHAHAALSEVAQHGTPEEKAKVRAAVHRRYPGIKVDGDGGSHAIQRGPEWQQRRKRWANSLIGLEARRSMKLARGNLEVRAKPDGTGGTKFEFHGYAATFGDRFEMWDRYGDRYEEEVETGAFSNSIRRPDLDTPFLIGHNEAGLPLARTWDTLKLGQDSRGMESLATMNGRRSDVQNLAIAVEDGNIDEMSIGFVTRGQRWSDDYETRYLTDLDLHRGDVSVVALAANPATKGVSMVALPTEILSRQAAEERAAARTTDDPDSDHMTPTVDANHGPWQGTHTHGHVAFGRPDADDDGNHEHEHDHHDDNIHEHVHDTDLGAESHGSARPLEQRGNPVDVSFGDAATYNADYNPRHDRATCPAGPNGSLQNPPDGKFCSYCGDALVRIDDQGVPGMEEEQGAQASLALRHRKLELLRLAGRR